jgi:thiamine-monophosphate kinase
VAFVWSLAIPPSWSNEDVVAFAEGAARLAESVGCPLLGGDLSSTAGPLCCSVTAVGRCPGVPVKRSGARAGQGVWLSQKVGASAAGLRLLQRDRPGGDEGAFFAWRKRRSDVEQRCVAAHVEPAPFHTLESLADWAVAAIDVSDGLARDAGRLARSSGIAIDLDGLNDAVAAGATVDDALFGGEDWALLFCVPDGLGDPPGCVRVGRVVEGEGVFVGGARVPDEGFDHFQRR